MSSEVFKTVKPETNKSNLNDESLSSGPSQYEEIDQ